MRTILIPVVVVAVAGLAGCSTVQPSSSRVAPPDMSKLIVVKVAGVTFSQEAASFVIHLDSTDKSGAAVRVPIFVGEREASVLNMKLSRQSPPRPLTHDLAVSFVSTLGGQIKYVVIEDIQEGVFLARIYLADNQGNLRSVDSRASDAIIVAVTAGIEIHAARKVLDKAGVKPEKPATSALSI